MLILFFAACTPVILRYWTVNYSASCSLFRGYKQLNRENADPEAISRDFLEAIRKFRFASRPYFYLSYHYLKNFEYGKASDVFQNGLEFNTDPAYYYNYAVLLKRMNRSPDCKNLVERSMELFPAYIKNYRLYLEIAGRDSTILKKYVQKVKEIWELRHINGELDTAENRDIVAGILSGEVKQTE